jgi:hypothetical protein
MEFSLITSSVKVSQNELFMAVAFAPNEKMNTNINIYKLDTDNRVFA